MAIEIKLPELGENIESADVVAVLVKEGDKVQKDQGLFEIETDKATIEVPSTESGIVQKILIKTGDKIKVGQTVLLIEDSSSVQEKVEDKKEKSSNHKNFSSKGRSEKRSCCSIGINSRRKSGFGCNIT
ncbi:MAG: hypothetical protein MZV64_12250 [Ignavibacteriales bacterium]|nr:hypothetical protein [Ignavibacteriales bacterium]